jgi:hypothetical protein
VWLAGVDHDDPALRARENQGCREAGGTAADDHYVVLVHVLSVTGLA